MKDKKLLFKLYRKQFSKDHYPDNPKFEIGQKVMVLKHLQEIYGIVLGEYQNGQRRCLIGVDILRRTLQGKIGIVYGIQKVCIKTVPQVGPSYEVKFPGRSRIVVMAEEQLMKIGEKLCQ